MRHYEHVLRERRRSLNTKMSPYQMNKIKSEIEKQAIIVNRFRMALNNPERYSRPVKENDSGKQNHRYLIVKDAYIFFITESERNYAACFRYGKNYPITQENVHVWIMESLEEYMNEEYMNIEGHMK
jgi:hypothetical protein